MMSLKTHYENRTGKFSFFDIFLGILKVLTTSSQPLNACEVISDFVTLNHNQ